MCRRRLWFPAASKQHGKISSQTCARPPGPCAESWCKSFRTDAVQRHCKGGMALFKILIHEIAFYHDLIFKLLKNQTNASTLKRKKTTHKDLWWKLPCRWQENQVVVEAPWHVRSGPQWAAGQCKVHFPACLKLCMPQILVCDNAEGPRGTQKNWDRGREGFHFWFCPSAFSELFTINLYSFKQKRPMDKWNYWNHQSLVVTSSVNPALFWAPLANTFSVHQPSHWPSVFPSLY